MLQTLKQLNNFKHFKGDPWQASKWLTAIFMHPEIVLPRDHLEEICPICNKICLLTLKNNRLFRIFRAR